MKSIEIIKLTYKEAKSFFMDQKNYVNFNVPYYFDFSDLLNTADGLIKNKDLCDVCKKNDNDKPNWPKYYENVNYTFLSNKDGAFAWRPLQLIHPILYVDLVNTITDEKSWKEIIERFNDFSKSYIECISIPRKSLGHNSDQASQVRHWWERIEQESVKLALEYSYIFTTDIANCYGSIYTHAIEWALDKGGKSQVKQNYNNDFNNSTKSLGAQIDTKLRNMNYGQTNGIPQGSALMDFVAEVILGYIDIELTSFLESSNINKEDFKILRYRDDYRIFVHNPVHGKEILKMLNKALYDFGGMKMSPTKTSEDDDIILASIKKEKLQRIFLAPRLQYYQKEALRIYQLSKKYPNSGLIVNELSMYHDRIENLKRLKNTNIDVLVSIFAMIAFNSPKQINWVVTILSLIIKTINDDHTQQKLIKKIHKKFTQIPNSSLIDVWLQRISAPLGVDIDYKDRLTKIAIQQSNSLQIWESSWLDDEIINKINSVKISNLHDKLEDKTIPTAIERSEVEMSKMNYND